MKIWIVRVRIDWHNCDPDDYTFAYESEVDALKKLDAEYKEVKRYIKKIEREIIWEEKDGDSARLMTSADDYYYSWIEEIDLKKKKI